MAVESQQTIVMRITTEYMDSLAATPLSAWPDLPDMRDELLSQINDAFVVHNLASSKEDRWRKFTVLPAIAVAFVLRRVLNIRRIYSTESDLQHNNGNYAPGIYCGDRNNSYIGTPFAKYFLFDGFEDAQGNIVADAKEVLLKLEGLYTKDSQVILGRFVDQLMGMGSTAEKKQTVNMLCNDALGVVSSVIKEHVLPMSNGYFDFEDRSLHPYSPEKVFMWKFPVSIDENAPSYLTDGNGDTLFDVEEWVSSLSDDPEVVSALWEILYAAFHPNVSWDTSIFLYGEKGCNGKSTFVSLLQSLLGRDAYVKANLEQMSQDQYLVGIEQKYLILGDENDTDRYVDSVATFKSLATGDEVTISPKYQNGYTIRFQGLIIQIMNSLPRVKDKTSALARRMLFIPFDKQFLGVKDPKIKDVYLKDPSILSYVVTKVLMRMDDIDAISHPKVSDRILDSFQVNNDPIRAFIDEYLPRLNWTVVPRRYLYDLFIDTYKKDTGGKPIQYRANRFWNDFCNLLDGNEEWEVMDRDGAGRNGEVLPNGLDVPEWTMLMLSSDKFDFWKHPSYAGANERTIVTRPDKTTIYGGIRYKGKHMMEKDKDFVLTA